MNSKIPDREVLDVVNDKEEITSSKTKEEIHRLGLLHCEIHVWFFDKEKNIYFSQTGLSKVNSSLFDASVGGHVDSGEDYINAAVREVKEESSLVISPSDLHFVLKFRESFEDKNKKYINNFFRSVYVYKKPISEKEIVEDLIENQGFQKFSIDFLNNMSTENQKLFHKFLFTHELPPVLEYIEKV